MPWPSDYVLKFGRSSLLIMGLKRLGHIFDFATLRIRLLP